MTQTLWITQGHWHSRWITMRDADAQASLDHHFGFHQKPNWTISDEDYHQEMDSFVPDDDQATLTAWEATVGAADYIPFDEDAPP